MKFWRISILIAFLSTPASAEVVVDQEFLTGPNFGYVLDYPGDYIAQTFSVQNSGQLAGIGVQVSISRSRGQLPPEDDLHVRLVRTDSFGAPAISDVLASYTIDRFAVPDPLPADQVLMADLTGLHLHVQAGDVLAIALSSNQTWYSNNNRKNYRWHMMTWNPHPGGAFYIYSPYIYGATPHLVNDRFDPPRNTRDMGFRVLINAVPEPASIVLGALGFLGIGSIQLRRG